MDYAKGVSLERQIAEKKQLGESEIRNISRQIVSAVHYIHQLGICHRDISLSNIIYDSKSSGVKLIDFNVSKIIGHKGRMVTQTGSL